MKKTNLDEIWFVELNSAAFAVGTSCENLTVDTFDKACQEWHRLLVDYAMQIATDREIVVAWASRRVDHLKKSRLKIGMINDSCNMNQIISIFQST